MKFECHTNLYANDPTNGFAINCNNGFEPNKNPNFVPSELMFSFLVYANDLFDIISDDNVELEFDDSAFFKTSVRFDGW